MKTTIFTKVFLTAISISAIGQTQNPYAIIQPKAEKFQTFSIEQIQPKGWLGAEIDKSLNGYTGKLDSLVPDLIVKDDIYGKNRLTKKDKSKDVGAITDGGEWDVQFLWWNSETQSNWWDGYIRNAIISKNPKHLARVKAYIENKIKTQDEDGYIGIYDKELRYHSESENGELWSKASLLRGFIAWYEYSKDPKVLASIEKAVANVMTNYPLNQSHPFYSIKPDVGGVTHGLTFTDVLESMYKITKNKVYMEYALFLYKDFSENNLNEDAQYAKLTNDTLKLSGHGAHTYEHLRSLTAAYYASGNPALLEAIQKFSNKINNSTTPAGGPIGDEWVAKNTADATSTGYEYCSIHELMHGYINLFIKTGETKWADKAEFLFFNAAQGARHPIESSIAYLKTDNSYAMTGGLNGDTTHKNQTRYKYSPVQQDVAVCCVPNAGRITPYFVQHMWLKDENGFVAGLLGASELTSKWKNADINIKTFTEYPFDTKLTFEVKASTSTSFALKIRKPDWAKQFSLNLPYKVENGFIVITKQWGKSEKVVVNFERVIETKQDLKGEHYFVYGNLVLAHPINAKDKTTKTYSLSGFRDVAYSPENLVVYQYVNNKVEKKTAGSEMVFTTNVYNPQTKQTEKVELLPMGKTILRQVTFKSK